MADQHKHTPHDEVEQQAQAALSAAKLSGQKRQLALWIAALIVGGILGWANVPALNNLFSFIATVFTRLFQFVAVPTIALAVITTLASLGTKRDTGRIFAHAVTYTLLTTICAAAVGLALFLWLAPANLPADVVGAGISMCRASWRDCPITITSSPSFRTMCSPRLSRETSSLSCLSQQRRGLDLPSHPRRRTVRCSSRGFMACRNCSSRSFAR